MFRHILVPTDLTERTVQVLDIAVKMAADTDCRVTLLHVIEVIQDAAFEDFEDFYTKLGKRATRKMEELIGQYKGRPIDIAREITYGGRVREIIRFATENDIDLIVLSSHPITADNIVEGWGTISYKVGILAHCPVMLVK